MKVTENFQLDMRQKAVFPSNWSEDLMDDGWIFSQKETFNYCRAGIFTSTSCSPRYLASSGEDFGDITMPCPSSKYDQVVAELASFL